MRSSCDERWKLPSDRRPHPSHASWSTVAPSRSCPRESIKRGSIACYTARWMHSIATQIRVRRIGINLDSIRQPSHAACARRQSSGLAFRTSTLAHRFRSFRPSDGSNWTFRRKKWSRGLHLPDVKLKAVSSQPSVMNSFDGQERNR